MNTHRFSIDMEFDPRVPVNYLPKLISASIVHIPSGNSFYAASSQYDRSQASAWLQENVLAQLGDVPLMTEAEITSGMLGIVSEFAGSGAGACELWADAGAFDRVLLAYLHGGMFGVPLVYGYSVHDVNTLRMVATRINPDLAETAPQQKHGAHSALEDSLHVARVVTHYSSLLP